MKEMARVGSWSVGERDGHSGLGLGGLELQSRGKFELGGRQVLLGPDS